MACSTCFQTKSEGNIYHPAMRIKTDATVDRPLRQASCDCVAARIDGGKPESQYPHIQVMISCTGSGDLASLLRPEEQPQLLHQPIE